MKQIFEFNSATRLHLQPILHACKKAILQFGNPTFFNDDQKFLFSFSCRNTVYAWIDNSLFSGALTIIFSFLLKNSEPESPITLTIGRIGKNTCQLLISTSSIESLDTCAEPVSLSSTGLDITELESFQYIMEMHGSCMQLWRYNDSKMYAFEIDLLCICEDKDFL